MSSTTEEQARRSSEITNFDLPTSPRSKAQAAWDSVKSNFDFKTRSSMPNLRRWLSTSRTTNSSSDAGNSSESQHRPEDETESLFCESLLGLMQQTGRFDYIDFSKERERGAESEDNEKFTVEKDHRGARAKRFSWSR